MSIKPHNSFLKLYYKLIAIDKIRFLVVGGIGFVVNFLMLVILYDWLDLPIALAQILGVEAAVLATFIGNNFWTFAGDHRMSLWKRLITFQLSAMGGVTINSTLVVVLTHFFHLFYGLSLAIGSIAGLIWNYTLYKRFVFSKKPIND